MRGFKVYITLQIAICKAIKESQTLAKTGYFISKTQIVTNILSIDDNLKVDYIVISSKVHKFLAE